MDENLQALDLNCLASVIRRDCDAARIVQFDILTSIEQGLQKFLQAPAPTPLNANRLLPFI